MKTRRNWIVATIVVALVASAILLAAAAVPGATSKARAVGQPDPSASPVLQVERNGVAVQSFTLDQIEALTAVNGWAGYIGKAPHGPDAVVGASIADIVAAALGTPLTAAESIDVSEVDATPYSQNFTGDKILDPVNGFTMTNATPIGDPAVYNPIAPADIVGPLTASLVYTDTDQNVMPVASGPLRFLIVDGSQADNAVMTGKYSVSLVNVLNVKDDITISLRPKPYSIVVGKTGSFRGVVKNAVAGDTVVKLRLITASGPVLKKAGTIGSDGSFKLIYRATKAGKWHFVVTYKAGRTFVSNKVTLTVRK